MKKSKFDLFFVVLEIVVGLITMGVVIYSIATSYAGESIYMPLFIIFYCVQAYNRRDTKKAYIASLAAAFLFFGLAIFILR